MGTLNIYTIDSMGTREHLFDSYSNVKEVSTERGHIHITFDVKSGCAGMHFPIPANFSRLELAEGANVGALHSYEVFIVPKGPGTSDGLTFTVLAASYSRAEEQAGDIVKRYHPEFVVWSVNFRE